MDVSYGSHIATCAIPCACARYLKQLITEKGYEETHSARFRVHLLTVDVWALLWDGISGVALGLNDVMVIVLGFDDVQMTFSHFIQLHALVHMNFNIRYFCYIVAECIVLDGVTSLPRTKVCGYIVY